MAVETKIIDIRVNYDDALSAIAQTEKAINDLNSAKKSLDKTTVDGKNKHAEYTSELKMQRQTLAELTREVVNNFKTEQQHVGYIQKLEAEVSNLTLAYKRLSKEELEGANGNQVLNKLKNTREELAKANEAYGNFTHSVGNYGNATSGIAISMGQIANEIPNFAISARIGIMSLSNNIPMLTDAIRNLNAENVKLKAAGEPTKSVFKELAKAVFSWQTLIAVGVSLLVAYGDKIWQWMNKAKAAKEQAFGLAQVTKLINDEMAKGGGVYGDAIKKIQSVENAQRQYARGTMMDREFLKIYNDELGNTLGKTDSITVALGNLSSKKDAYISAMKDMAFANALFAESAKNAVEIIKIQTASNSDILGENASKYKDAISEQMRALQVLRKTYEDGNYLGTKEQYDASIKQSEDYLKTLVQQYNDAATKRKNERISSIQKEDDLVLSNAKKFYDKSFDIAKNANIDLVNEDNSSRNERLKNELAAIDLETQLRKNAIEKQALDEYKSKDWINRQMIDMETEQLNKKLALHGLEKDKIAEINGQLLDQRSKLLDSLGMINDTYFEDLGKTLQKHDVSLKSETEKVLKGLKDLQVDINKQQEENFRNQLETMDMYLNMSASFGGALGNIVGDAINGTEDSVRESVKNLLLISLDQMKAYVEMAVLKITAEGLASMNPAQMAIALGKVALVEAGFAALKAVVSNSLSSVDSRKSSSSNSNRDNGNNETVRKYHSGGTILGKGEVPMIGLSGESVMNRNATNMFAPLLSSLNQLGGGKEITSGVGDFASRNGEDMLAKAFAKALVNMPSPTVTIKDFEIAQKKVNVMDSITSFSSKN